ncbi:zinc-dependent alcohol dehydrogenase family protein [Stygiobacter electus]|uniref:NAD(P)-dependent alcohol dehydrogenase n=1 Tax=Stygiobacter electus TaxID=3032292 RepID=A0AAE3TD95_9BACT|nr:NAD(P)-dependent alcohol dehydrogenase [Stygiobacter electus]MDF1613228.1 NAD(P)-dependent alcohol dehydrogenase [Stygiobacter electus]
MKAIVVKNSYGLENVTIEEIPQPLVRANEVLLKISAVSLNQLDLMVAKGAFGTQLPHILGSDAVGVIEKVGTGVTLFKVEDMVSTHFIQAWQSGQLKETYLKSSLGTANEGVFSEYVVLPETSLVKIPHNLSAEEASTLPIAGLTAWESLVNIGKLKAGETVLLKGTGGVSVFALQFAKIMGAKVIITSSDNEKLATAKKLGADITINYKTEVNWQTKVLELTNGKGVDLALETAWVEIEKTIQAMRFGGTVVAIGLLGGHEANISFFSILQKKISIRGIQVGSKSSFEAMNRAIEVNNLQPIIDKVFTISDLSKAFNYFDAGKHFGKVVIRF